MQSPASFRPTAPLAPMPSLFARYVAGQIADTFWDRLMQVLDANDTPPEERLALAAFLNDAFFELGLDTIKMPQSDEVKELLAEVITPPSPTHGS